ncbi:MAG: glycosyltransferase family 9 protein, partial [Terracidiphilus sp.]
MLCGPPLADSAPAPRGVLLIRLCNWVGEAVLSLPALRRLAAAGYELRLYGKSWAPALFSGAGWPVTVRHGGVRNAAAQLRGLRHQLDDRGAAPPALLMTNSLSSALETRLAGFAPSGYAREGRSLLLRHAYPLPGFAHAAESYWHLAGCLLGVDEPLPAGLAWVPSARQRAQARELLGKHGFAPGSFIIFCPFSGPDDPAHRKVWPGFRDLARRLGAAGMPVMVCPGPGEEAAAAALGTNILPLPGVDLGVYGALFELARAVVANDTGPGHLAAAAGARLVAVYGPHSAAV